MIQFNLQSVNIFFNSSLAITCVFILTRIKNCTYLRCGLNCQSPTHCDIVCSTWQTNIFWVQWFVLKFSFGVSILCLLCFEQLISTTVIKLPSLFHIFSATNSISHKNWDSVFLVLALSLSISHKMAIKSTTSIISISMLLDNME